MGIGSLIAGGMNTFLNPVGAFFGKIGSGLNSLFGSNLFGTGYSIGQDLYNIYQQEQQNQRTMNLQQQLWERDDNALTRLMKQYQDNGINPLLALPNVSQGNTKGFETSAIQSKINYEQERMAREQYKLNKERQELELSIMNNQNRRQEEEHQKILKTKDYENQLLKAKVNGAKAYAKVYGAGLGLDLDENEGYIPPFAQNEYEKIFSTIATVLHEINDNAEPGSYIVENKKMMSNVEDNVVRHPNPVLHPNTYTYNGRTFYYHKYKNGKSYQYNGAWYLTWEEVKNAMDSDSNPEPTHKSGKF